MKNSAVISFLGSLKVLKRVYNMERGEERVVEWGQSKDYCLLSPNLECDLINTFTLFCML